MLTDGRRSDWYIHKLFLYENKNIQKSRKNTKGKKDEPTYLLYLIVICWPFNVFTCESSMNK